MLPVATMTSAQPNLKPLPPLRLLLRIFFVHPQHNNHMTFTAKLIASRDVVNYGNMPSNRKQRLLGLTVWVTLPVPWTFHNPNLSVRQPPSVSVKRFPS